MLNIEAKKFHIFQLFGRHFDEDLILNVLQTLDWDFSASFDVLVDMANNSQQHKPLIVGSENQQFQYWRIKPLITNIIYTHTPKTSDVFENTSTESGTILHTPTAGLSMYHCNDLWGQQPAFSNNKINNNSNDPWEQENSEVITNNRINIYEPNYSMLNEGFSSNEFPSPSDDLRGFADPLYPSNVSTKKESTDLPRYELPSEPTTDIKQPELETRVDNTKKTDVTASATDCIGAHCLQNYPKLERIDENVKKSLKMRQ